MLVDGQARRPTWQSSTRSGFARTTAARNCRSISQLRVTD